MTVTSDPFLIDGKSFVIKTEKNTATVVRTSTGKALTQTEKEIAGDNYNSDTNEINYATIYDLNFGANYLTQLGASDEWMSSAVNNKQYKDIFKKATGKLGYNIDVDAGEIDSSKLWSPTALNQDANGTSTLGKSNVLHYPLNKDKNSYDYLKISAYKYRPKGFGEDSSEGFGITTEISEMKKLDRKKGAHTVYLPMQPGLSEGNGVGWGEDTLNAVEAGLAGIAGGTIQGASKNLKESYEGGAAGVSKTISKLREIEAKEVSAYFAGKAVGKNVMTRATGKVVNQNLELLFTGPQLRSFNYTYRFTPREKKEAEMIKRIIKFFKSSMAPRRSDQRVFLETPHVYRLKYIYKNGEQHPFLNKIKTCALRNFSIQYTPDGSYMTYDDGSMTSYEVQLTFGEMNPIYANDFENDTNDMGY